MTTATQTDEKKAAKKASDEKKAANIQAAANGEPEKIATPEAPPAAPEPPFLFGLAGVPGEVITGLATDRIVHIDPDFLSVQRGFNVRDFSARENQERVGELAGLIEANGYDSQYPMLVRVIPETPEEGARIAIVAGETRLRAVRKLREEKGASFIASVPVMLAQDKSETDRVVDFIVGNSGKNLSMLETLSVVSRLKADGMKRPEIQRRLAFSHTAMRNLDILGWTTPKIREFIRDGWLTGTHVVDKLRDTEGDETKVNAVEKALSAVVARRQKEGQKAAKGASTSEGESEGEEGTKRGAGAAKGADGVNPIIFNRGTFNAYQSALQDLYAELANPEARAFAERLGFDKDSDVAKAMVSRYSELRKTIAGALSNANAPTVNAAKIAEAKKALAALEGTEGE